MSIAAIVAGMLLMGGHSEAAGLFLLFHGLFSDHYKPEGK